MKILCSTPHHEGSDVSGYITQNSQKIYFADDALTTVTVINTIINNLSANEYVINIFEKGPFTGEIEDWIYESLLAKALSSLTIPESNQSILFSSDETLPLKGILSCCMLFSWDFELRSSNPDSHFINTHDLGLYLLKAPREFIDKCNHINLFKQK